MLPGLPLHEEDNHILVLALSGLPAYKVPNQSTLSAQSELPALSQQFLARVFMPLPLLALQESLIIQNTAQETAQIRPKRRGKSFPRLS